MKCIDAIEGTVKTILNQLHKTSLEDRLDDSEYIRNAKAVIDATSLFIHENPEIVENPDLLKKVLYEHSRNLWLWGQPHAPEEALESVTDNSEEREEYQTYYYDYLYHRGLYPR